MRTAKNYVIAFLLLTTVAGALLAWNQYQELIQLRANALQPNERADLQKRLWATEKRKHELEAALAARARGPAGGGEDGQGAPSPGGPEGRGNLRTMGANFVAMMEQPEIQKLMAVQQKAALDGRYATLFKNLNLTPEQLEKFKNLLVEKQTALTDALAAAREQGINPRTDPEDFQKLITAAQADADNNIKATLGDAGYAQYQQYQQTLPQRNVVNQLAQSLSYTTTPLTPDQSEQLVSILAANAPASNNPGNSTRATIAAAFGVGFGGAQANTPITTNAIAQARTVLAPPQVAALQQLQAAQQAQAQLTQAMRNQFRNAGPGGASTGTSTATPPPKTGRGGG